MPCLGFGGRALSADSDAHVFLYHYTFLPETLGFPFNRLGSFHGSELVYVPSGGEEKEVCFEPATQKSSSSSSSSSSVNG